jgi:hypothetical protein
VELEGAVPITPLTSKKFVAYISHSPTINSILYGTV